MQLLCAAPSTHFLFIYFNSLRWLPKGGRYEIAGLFSLFTDWPLNCVADFEIFEVKHGSSRDNPEHDGLSEGGEWRRKEMSITNLIATSLPRLGVDHPICRDVTMDDGRLALAFMSADHSRQDAIEAGMSMKAGNYLAEHKAMQVYRCTEFKITPKGKGSVPVLIDGDPEYIAVEHYEDSSINRTIHVKCLEAKLSVFCDAPIAPVGDQRAADHLTEKQRIRIGELVASGVFTIEDAAAAISGDKEVPMA